MRTIKELSRRALDQIRPYEPGKPIEEVKAEYGLTRIIKLASNENPLGPSPKAVAAISQALGELHLYPDANSTALKADLAARFNLSTDQIAVGNGSDELIKRLAETFLTAEDEIVVAKPTFSEYRFAAQLMGATTREVPCRDGLHDLAGMREAIGPKTKMVFICNPNNPTGTYVPGELIADFISQLPRDLLVIFDEAYAEYVTASDYASGLSLLPEYPNVVVLRTFSKIYGLAALRIGYAMASPEIIGLLEKAREPFNVNRLAQIAARAALSDIEFLERSRQSNNAGIEQLLAGFARFDWEPVPTQTNFILVDTKRDARELFKQLLAQGVIIRPADIFGLPTYIRVTVGTEEENALFLQAVAKILADQE